MLLQRYLDLHSALPFDDPGMCTVRDDGQTRLDKNP